MKTDVIQINSLGEGIEEALRQTENAAAFRGLSHKETLRLQLLAEDMTGMMRTIIGNRSANYWVEANGTRFSLHLAMKARMDLELRDALLQATTTGKNSAAKGFMGTLRDIFMQMSEPVDASRPLPEYGFVHTDIGSFDAPMDVGFYNYAADWSLEQYRKTIASEENVQKWDELEKSITARLADEVKIYINGDAVEMVIEKEFGKEQTALKSDLILIDNKGNGLEEALAQTEEVAKFRGLSDKEAVQLRLITEELMGLARSVTGELAASFWIESENKAFTLHLSTKTVMDATKRYQLISSSTSQKNEAAKGFIGMLREALSSAMLSENDGVYYDFNGQPLAEAPQEEWDHYERSILRKLADEIRIGVRGGAVDMTVLKHF